ncbi:MAG: ParB/RepB/Spo0J family partition protein [Giesbergeria sp.]
MNTVTHQEVQALQAATPAQNMLLVPLSQLRPSKRNVRKTLGASINALASSIHRVGLLQNLTVILASDGEHYEVVAGSRRLAALKLLAKKHRIAKDYAVPCLLVADASARTASLTENVQREAMHPADQFEAFAALIDEGRPIEDIAADFGVTPLVVQRRLKLANVSPRLMADYRADEVNLDQLMALAITDDHAAQEAAFYDAPNWQRNPTALRERLTEREIDAHRHPLVRFVGLDTYEAAGGAIRRDLFADADQGIYLSDTGLLDRLAQDKLEGLADTVRAEGWAWVEAVPATTYADLQAFQRAPKEPRKANAREAKRIAKLQAKLQEIGQALESALEAEDEEKAEALDEEGRSVGDQLEALEAELLAYSPSIRAAAGVVVTLDRQGEPVIHRGLLREAEAKALRTLARVQGGMAPEDTEDEDSPEPKKAGISEKLARRLSAHRTAALQIELARNPQASLAALVHGMVQRVLQNAHAVALPIGISVRPQDRLEGYALDWPQSPAAAALRELQQAWGEKLPRDDAELFAVLLALPQDELVRLLAVCVASTVDVVSSREHDARGKVLAQAVGLDMAVWWTPTADGYFSHVSKAVILEAVQEFAPGNVSRLAKLKKADIASEAERLVVGTGWMPAMLKSEDSTSAAQDDAQQESSQDAMNDTPAEARQNAAIEVEEVAEALAA